ncbi:MAG: hypothetical protein GF332_03705 [Candidatus Moranbacteria bacterium]|nr:hypothetical protein [Candidatus Moranbacteria bacterium]
MRFIFSLLLFVVGYHLQLAVLPAYGLAGWGLNIFIPLFLGLYLINSRWEDYFWAIIFGLTLESATVFSKGFCLIFFVALTLILHRIYLDKSKINLVAFLLINLTVFIVYFLGIYLIRIGFTGEAIGFWDKLVDSAGVQGVKLFKAIIINCLVASGIVYYISLKAGEFFDHVSGLRKGI